MPLQLLHPPFFCSTLLLRLGASAQSTVLLCYGQPKQKNAESSKVARLDLLLSRLREVPVPTPEKKYLFLFQLGGLTSGVCRGQCTRSRKARLTNAQNM